MGLLKPKVCLYVPLLLFLIVIIAFPRTSFSKTYDPCELAHEMIGKHKFLKADIADWICLIKHESDFNTSAIGRLNSDGSLDHGLFQISDLYWCNHGTFEGACGINCVDLQNDDIKDDSICARRIFRATKHRTGNGFNAWAAWKQHCEHKDVKAYIADCSL